MTAEDKPLGLKKILILVGGAVGTIALMIIIIVVMIVATKPSKDQNRGPTPEEIVDAALRAMPIIDGRNNFPSNIRDLFFNDLSKFDFNSNLSQVPPWSENEWVQTDLPKLKEGKVGAEFWSALPDCTSQYKDAVSQTMEQIDVIKRLVAEYEEHLQLARSADDIEEAITAGKIASLINVGGGHSLHASIGVLRLYYELGVRSLTLTHSCNTPWADSSTSDELLPPESDLSSGISEFGNSIIEEMNRLGLIIDLSFASKDAALSALRQSTAPVIFSSSGAYSLCKDHRNVQDEVLQLVKEKNSLVMISVDVSNTNCHDELESVEDIAEHIEYIRNATGIDNVGIGGNYDGTKHPAMDLEDPSKYPDLFVTLARTGRWTQEDLEKLSGRNLLRVFRDVEQIRDKLQENKKPIQRTISAKDLDNHGVDRACMTAKYRQDL